MMNSVTLESVEDAFLELGKGHGRDPPAVEKWDARLVLDGYLNHRRQISEDGDGDRVEDVVSDDKLSPSCDRFGLIAQAKDVAWIQCIVTEEEFTVGSEYDRDNRKVGGDDGDSCTSNGALLEEEKKNEDLFVSTPIVMDIEIGNGSWETSWIQSIKREKTSSSSRNKNEEEKEGNASVGSDQDADIVDYASFIILPVWKV